MTDPNVPAAVRLRAAEFVFNCGIKGIEVEDIEVRLANLEEATERTRAAAEDDHCGGHVSITEIGGSLESNSPTASAA